jgi:hypothetical protein
MQWATAMQRAERLLKRSMATVGEKIQISDIAKFPVNFWLISLVCVAYCGSSASGCTAAAPPGAQAGGRTGRADQMLPFSLLLVWRW